jgi:hypothetical protein
MGQINVGVYDSALNPFPDHTEVLYYIRDGAQRQVLSKSLPPQTIFKLPVHDNLDDNYTVIASVPGHGTAGYHRILVSPNVVRIVRLMLLPHQPRFDFSGAAWDNLQQAYPRLWNLLSGRAANPQGNPKAPAFYQNLVGTTPKAAACLLNILTAMDQIQLSGAETPLDFLKDIIWDDPANPLKQDRFYCWVDPKLADAIKSSGGMFQEEPTPSAFHGATATRSWKEAEFAEANVQFTFHDGITHPDHPDWVLLEPDIDYFKDLGAHFFGEVVVNWFGSLTEPAQVYQLRWIAGNRPGVNPFEPPYTIV